MKNLLKLKTFFLSLVAISSSLTAEPWDCYESCEIDPCCLSGPLFEAKVGYFFFTDAKMRKIYDQGGLDVQLALTYPLWNIDNGWTLTAYGAVEYMERSGRSINGNEKTSLWSVPVNIGLKPILTIDEEWQFYYAIGPRFFYIHQHNHSPYVYKNKSKNGIGYFINTGFHYLLSDHLLIDLFG